MKKYILAVVLLFALVIALQAQESNLTQSYLFENLSLEVFYSENWEIIEDEDKVSFESENTAYVPYWYFPADYSDLELTSGDLEAVLRVDFGDMEDFEFDPDEIDTLMIGSVELAIYPYTAEDDAGDYDAIRIAREFDWGGYVVAVVYPLTDAELDENDVEEAITMTAFIQDPLVVEGIGQAGGGISFAIPEDWLYFIDDLDRSNIQNEATNATFYYLLAEDFEDAGVEAGDVPASKEQLFYFVLGEDAVFDEDNISVEGDYTFYEYEVEVDGETLTGVLVSIELEDGSLLSTDIYSLDSSEELNTDDVDVVLEAMSSAQREEE